MHELHLQFPVSGDIHFMSIIAGHPVLSFCVYCPSEPPCEMSGNMRACFSTLRSLLVRSRVTQFFRSRLLYPSESLREKLGRAANCMFSVCIQFLVSGDIHFMLIIAGTKFCLFACTARRSLLVRCRETRARVFPPFGASS